MSHIVVGSVLNPYSVLTHSTVFSFEMSLSEIKILKENIYKMLILTNHHVDIDFSFYLLDLL